MKMLNALLLTILAGLSTLIGALIIFFIKDCKDSYLNIAMGFSAGVMIFISFVELLGEGIKNLGYFPAIMAFFGGMFVIYLIDFFIPHYYESECPAKESKRKFTLKRCGILVAVGIAIHNFPEGIAVFFSSLANFHLGLVIAFAIALHNIPEGIAIAMPIYYSTKDRLQAFKYSFFAGIVEPIGAIIAFLFLYQFINDYILSIILAAVGGIMVFISFDELLPRVYEKKNGHTFISGIFIGMLVMAISLLFI